MTALDVIALSPSPKAPQTTGQAGGPAPLVSMMRKGLTGVIRPQPKSAASHAADEREHTNMGQLIRARGWLRASEFGSSTATFQIDMATTPATGCVQAEVTMMVEAAAAGHATLVTENGSWIEIRTTGRTPAGLGFTVLSDRERVARYFS